MTSFKVCKVLYHKSPYCSNVLDEFAIGRWPVVVGMLSGIRRLGEALNRALHLTYVDLQPREDREDRDCLSQMPHLQVKSR